MVSGTIEMDLDELVQLVKSFKKKYAGDAEYKKLRAGFPKSWPL